VTYARPLHVLIVAAKGHERDALCRRLEGSGIVVCAEAPDGVDALRVAADKRPDLCVVATGAGFDALGLVDAVNEQAPGVRVVLVGAEPDDEALLAAVDAGASGYLSSAMDSSRLAAALRDVVANRPAFPRRLGTLLIARLCEANGCA
jgi:DNA-binding NarL/FixJ family response regulator